MVDVQVLMLSPNFGMKKAPTEVGAFLFGANVAPEIVACDHDRESDR